MRVVAVVHSDDARAYSFEDVAHQLGHELVEWRASDGPPAPDAAALLVLGGSMHPDQEHDHPWLRGERTWLGELLEQGVPMLGVCLGAELLAQVAGWPVTRLPIPEIGWYEVALTREASADPLIAALPERFPSFQWHSYAAEPADGAPALATSRACVQAYRVGERAWGVQFHPEVTAGVVEAWISDDHAAEEIRAAGSERDEIRTRTQAEITAWNVLGRDLFSRFLELAAR